MKIQVGSTEFNIDQRSLEGYLTRLTDSPVQLIDVKKVGEGFHNVGFSIATYVGGVEKRFVMRIVRGDTGWGHDYLSDRAAVLLLQHRLCNTAPQHTCVKSIDVAAVLSDGQVASIGRSVEFFNLVEQLTESDCDSYSNDLMRIAKSRVLTGKDLARCTATADYLVNLHSKKKDSPILYRRHIRDLIGHGEMLMGVIDTYPSVLNFTSPEEIADIEVNAVRWRNKIKSMCHRLARIHGDYHPFGNIRFRKDDSLMALDPAREEFGEPADDVSCMSINYIFFSIWHYGSYEGPFQTLFNLFMQRYLEQTGDKEMLKVIAPFYAFRGLVVAHPLYYPEMEDRKRRMIFNFIANVLNSEEFEPKSVSRYLEG